MANWQTSGNPATPGDFLGTTNMASLPVRTNNQERLVVRDDGDVGIGLPDPRTQLHVYGRISTGLDFRSAGSITFYPPDGFAWFHIDNGPNDRRTGRLRISAGPNPGSNEMVSVLQSGNVGIGRPDPDVKLHVTGNRVRLESESRKLDLRADGGAVDVQSDTSDLYLHSAGPGGHNRVIINPFGNEGNVGIGTTAPTDKLHVVGNIRANDLIVTSDAALKEDVRPMRDALFKIQQMRGVEFRWKGGPDSAPPRQGAGVLAQDVEEASPELVLGATREAKHRGVNLGGLVGMLIEAVKELAEENGALRRRLDAVEEAHADS